MNRLVNSLYNSFESSTAAFWLTGLIAKFWWHIVSRAVLLLLAMTISVEERIKLAVFSQSRPLFFVFRDPYQSACQKVQVKWYKTPSRLIPMVEKTIHWIAKLKPKLCELVYQPTSKLVRIDKTTGPNHTAELNIKISCSDAFQWRWSVSGNYQCFEFLSGQVHRIHSCILSTFRF